MKSNNTFQTGALILFGAGIIIAVVIFAVTKASTSGVKPALVVWGVENRDVMLPLLQDFDNSGSTYRVQYEEKAEEAFDTDFLTALAEGKGPDAVIIPDRMLEKHKNLFYTIPYASYPQRTFIDAFAPISQSLLSEEGVTAIPLLVDPLVMYWNRDLYAKAGTLVPPKVWDEFVTLAPKISVFDKSLRLSQSLIAFGDAQNVPHSKEILLALWLQSTCSDATKPCAINAADESSTALASSVDFFAAFADPSKAAYSWNRSEQNAESAFLSGELATYFGYASELSRLQKKNANLNFDIAYLPQPKDAQKPITYGAMSVFAIVKTSRNLANAFSLGVTLSTRDMNLSLAKALGVSPIRNDLLSASPEDVYSPIIFGSILRSRGWLDPNPVESSKIFSKLVGDVVSGASASDEAAGRASAELADLSQ